MDTGGLAHSSFLEKEVTSAVERGNATRQRVSKTALKLFGKKGFNNTRLSEVLSAARITKGGFSFHFNSSEELGLAVIDSVVRIWVERIPAEAVREKDPMRRIHRMFELQETSWQSKRMRRGTC